MSIFRKAVRPLVACAGLAALTTGYGLAAAETERPVIEEIIVTATLRESSLMETPQAPRLIGLEFTFRPQQ